MFTVMTNFLMSDPDAIRFVSSANIVVVFDVYVSEFEDAVRSGDGTADIDAVVERVARRVASDANLQPSTETVSALSYLFVRYCAEMNVLSRWE